jgi:WD40 repeat protein
MVATGYTIRIFVSSTFADLHAERDALQASVFPRLRTLCESQGARFQAIDLRWGVSQEAALDQQAMAICIEEIRRSQRISPRINFLSLLGDRYGTRLPPESIAAADFEAISGAVSSSDASLLSAWYRRDENAVPPHYHLLPRTGEYVEYARWLSLRERLRRILAQACERVPTALATRSEVTSSITEREIEEGVFRHADGSHALAFFREFRGTPRGIRAGDYVEGDAESRRLLDELKRRLLERVPQGVTIYQADWRRNGPTRAHIPAFCDEVYQQLAARIQHALGESREAETTDAESAIHGLFGQERIHHFVGREQARADIRNYLSHPADQPLIITGASGTGKTTLMAQAAEDAIAASQGVTTLTRYIGITPNTSTLRPLLEDICHQIARFYPESASGPIATDLDELIRQFPEALAAATEARPLILFLDALDQLRDERPSYSWLPTTLPPHVHVVVSVLPGDDLQALRQRFALAHSLSLGGLSREEGGVLLARWLADAGRRLQTPQQDAILQRFAAHGLPLYLRLAFDEARRWPSWYVIGEFPRTIPEILRAAFLRLESPATHGPVLVAHALGDIGAAKYGLSEDEILDLLSRDRGVMAQVRSHSVYTGRIDRLPFVIWARLYADLESYLAERGADGATVVTYYHRQLSEAVSARYLNGRDGIARHRDLARYYLAQPLVLRTVDHASSNRRKLSELAYQQANGILHKALKRTLTDVGFLQRKIAYEGTESALADLALSGTDADVVHISGALRLGARILNRDERQLANQIVGRIGHVAALHDAPEEIGPRLQLESTTLTSPRAPALSTYNGHRGSVHRCAFSPDGTRVLSASADFSLRLWDASTGRSLLTFEGHTGSVNGCAFGPTGRLVASASEDTTLGLWDGPSGKLLHLLEGHTNFANGCAFSQDGSLIASASEDTTVRLWSVETRETLRVLRGHQDGVRDCAFSPDGKLLVSASKDRMLRLWDVAQGTPLRTLAGHEAPVFRCAFSPDGSLIASASDDRTVRLWRVAGDGEALVLRGHGNFVHGCAFSPDGQLVLSAASDNTLRLWAATTGELIAVVRGHETWVNDCAFSPDGTRFVSACYDGSLRLWDLATRETVLEMKSEMNYVRDCLYWPARQRALDAARNGVRIWNAREHHLIAVGSGHQGYVSGCAISPDGTWALTSSADQTLRVWDTANWRTLEILTGHTDIVYGCAISPDGTWALSASADSTLRLWNTTNWQLERVLTGHTDQVRCCAFSPNGALALSTSWDRTIRLWDIHSGLNVRVFAGHTDNVRGCAFNADGTRFLSASYDRTLRWWEVATGAVLRELSGHTSWVFDCALLDGDKAISVADDATLKLWSLDAGQPLATWYADAPLTCCDASPRDHLILAGDSLGNLHFLRQV